MPVNRWKVRLKEWKLHWWSHGKTWHKAWKTWWTGHAPHKNEKDEPKK